MKVFLNPNCSFGEGASKWEKVKKQLRERIGDFDTEVITSPGEIYHQILKAVTNDDYRLIAAGGDGTVNLILNAIMKLDDPSIITLGAVGLGSSNDFHKPVDPAATIGGIPVRTDFRNAFRYDVIEVKYLDPDGSENIRYCLINASIGITAEGNAIFTSGGHLLKMIQRLSVETAITLSAIKAIITFRDIACRLKISESEFDAEVSNLGVIKNPHFTGKLCYDTKIEPDDGTIGINLCTDLNLLERINILTALYKHHFSGLPKTRCWKSSSLKVTSNRIFTLEMDGEIVRASIAEFNVIPKKVRCCR